MPFDAFTGMRVLESVDCVRDGEPYQVRRRWRDRLFSRPWRPWVATLTVVPKIPHSLQLGPRTILAHPAIVRRLREISR